MTMHVSTGKRVFARSLLAAAAMALFAAPSQAQDVKVGFLGGITGPIAKPVVHIIKAMELALKEVNSQGGVLGGKKLVMVSADSKCSPQDAVAAANKLVNVDNVVGIVGGLCSSEAIAAANASTIPGGTVLISPSATSPAITTLKDHDLVFRVAPSDTFQGKILAKAVLAQGIKKVALTYVNNDYGKGIADNFRAAFTKGGGTIAGDQAHEDKKSSYRSELATLAKGGAKYLVLIAYPQSSAPIIIRQSLEGGLFKRFIGPEAFFDKALWKAVGIKNIEGAMYTRPASAKGKANDIYAAAMKKFAKASYGQLFTAQTYDATFLMALAIEKAGSADKSKISAALRSVANGKGMKILPGQWKKAVAAIKAGKAIDYVGASGPCDFDANGDVAGSYNFFQIRKGKPVLIKRYGG
jgi:branched-chain amino acid transport system substrate-binding protein